MIIRSTLRRWLQRLAPSEVPVSSHPIDFDPDLHGVAVPSDPYDVNVNGAALLAEGSPLGDLVRSEAIYCCSFVFLWAREVAGLEPRPSDRWATTFAAAYNDNPQLWAAGNVWDKNKPWTACEAVRDLLGGTLLVPLDVDADTPPPPLTPGRWHVVQRWKGLVDNRVVGTSQGHTFLAKADRLGAVVIYQSDTARGFRVSPPGAWTGLEGHTVQVLTLPHTIT